jgi:hypothetical protein
MPATKSIALEGKLAHIGAVHFLRAEWQRDRSRFVLIRYALDGRQQPFGLRLDLDNRVLLDSVDDPEVDQSVKALTEEIWSVVATERFKAESIIPTAEVQQSEYETWEELSDHCCRVRHRRSRPGRRRSAEDGRLSFRRHQRF